MISGLGLHDLEYSRSDPGHHFNPAGKLRQSVRQVDVYSTGLVWYMSLDPGRTLEDLEEFKSGIVPDNFGTPSMRLLLIDMTSDDIEARPEAIQVVQRCREIKDELRRLFVR